MEAFERRIDREPFEEIMAALEERGFEYRTANPGPEEWHIEITLA